MFTASAKSRDHGRGTHSQLIPMTTCAFAWLAVLLLFPLVLLWNLTESKGTKIRRARSNGHKWTDIAKRFNTSPTTAARWAKA